MSDETASCKLNPETIAIIDRRAKQAGMSRSECLRRLIMAGIGHDEDSASDRESAPFSKNTVELLQETLYALQRIHISMFGIAGLSGIDQAELEKLSEETRGRSLKYLANLDTRIAQTRQQLIDAESTK